ncbi:MAG: YncE family protein [Bacteroidales bacterium]|jgi:YVTN family beta-propeller protein|nr:YncE family protein [Bacteroidales bacterium]
MKKNTKNTTVAATVVVLLLACLPACRKTPPVTPPVITDVTTADSTAIGFYLLNEGNMGVNKSTIDYFDCVTGKYHQNIYANANPNVPLELGDGGNDIQIYGSKLYAVINLSQKVEVMEKDSAKRTGQINIPNCRYIKFHNGFAYITSHAGPVEMNPDYKQIGYVAKVDTATLQIVASCNVGFQPDGLEIANGKIYVANSGGYMAPNYENTVSVIDIATFKEIKRIKVEINLHRLQKDKHGNLWVSSRGNYGDKPSRLFWIDMQKDTCMGMIDIAVSNFWLNGDSLYIIGSEWNYTSMQYTIAYNIVNVNTKQVVSQNFITDGTENNIKSPYGIAVNPNTKDIYVTDANDYVLPGTLYCFDKNGKQKWNVRTGNVPAHFAFLMK